MKWDFAIGSRSGAPPVVAAVSRCRVVVVDSYSVQIVGTRTSTTTTSVIEVRERGRSLADGGLCLWRRCG